jgi:hypothetical protein
VEGYSLVPVGHKAAFRLVILLLIFSYLVQYPLTRLIEESRFDSPYEAPDWLRASYFVILSSLLLLGSLRLGAGRGPLVLSAPNENTNNRHPVAIPIVLLVFGIFMLWSYLMFRLKIGMTIYVDFAPLPLRLVGFLFYGRLLVQPIVWAYICRSASTLLYRVFLFVLTLILGSYASLVSGSRFAGILFAIPVLLLFRGRIRYILLFATVIAFIMIATMTRTFFLPYYINENAVRIYANESYQADVLDDAMLLPLRYIVNRTMGMGEVLMTLRFGDICPTTYDSFLDFSLAFLPLTQANPACATIKNVYGLSNDAFGGFGLDAFSNYWVLLGGDGAFFSIGLFLLGLAIGRCYRLSHVLAQRFGFPEVPILIYTILLALFVEGRPFIMPIALLVMMGLARICSYPKSRVSPPRLRGETRSPE